VSIKLKTDLIP